ncbi:hypothetical protein ACFL35_07875 [Candidatus Riflebacteria bacterium]
MGKFGAPIVKYIFCVSLLLIRPVLHCQEIETVKSEENPQLLLAAPHGGYDLFTEKIVRDIAERSGFSTIIAIGFRSIRKKRYINVNRPTERLFHRGRLLKDEVHTLRARRVYTKYLAELKKITARTKREIRLYVEFHGNSRVLTRRKNIAGKLIFKKHRRNVIELATTGFGLSFLRRLKKKYKQIIPNSGFVPLRIACLDGTYQLQHRHATFIFKARGARLRGIFRSDVIKYGLHFELPIYLRRTEEKRESLVRIFSRLLLWVAKEL